MMNYMTSNTRIPPYMVFPRFLLDLRLNGTARLLYTILLDRARLSQGNAKFTDEKGQVYVIFPIESLATAINKSEMTVKNALSDLEKQGLIKRKHQKVGQTTHIYVKLPADSHLPISLTKTRLGQKPDTCEQAIDYSPENTDNNQSSSQKDFFPSHGQDPVSLAGRKLSGNKNNKIKETQNNKEPDDKDILNAFGRYHNVFLSAKDLEELKAQIPDYQNYIERLSAYMQSKKKSYTDHAATILSWAQRDHAVRPARTYTFKEGESL